MAPSVPAMVWATPAFPVPAWVFAGHWTVEALPSVQSAPADFCKNDVKFWVVPEPSARWTTVMLVDGSLAPGFSAMMAGSFHVVILTEKILASVGPLSFRLSTPDRLYETVIGPATVGKYRKSPPLYMGLSESAIVESDPAKL